MIEGDEETLQVTQTFRDGRRRYDAASKARLVAAGLEAGVSVSGLALKHGINANLLRKWLKEAKEPRALRSPSASAFIPVVAADRNLSARKAPIDLPAKGQDPSIKTEETPPRPTPSKVSARLPNGVRLTLECGNAEALTAIIGAFGHVQTGR